MEVCRCTIDAVAQVGDVKSSTVLHDVRRNTLMRACLVPVVGQHLSEEDIVVGPDGVEAGRSVIVIQSLIYRCRYRSAGIAEITVSKAVFDVATSRIDRY